MPPAAAGGAVEVMRCARARALEGSVERADAPLPRARELGDVRELALLPCGVTPGVFVLHLDPDLELYTFDAPRAGAAHPDRGELARADEVVDRRHVDGEDLGRVGEREEPADLFTRTWRGHVSIIDLWSACRAGCG